MPCLWVRKGAPFAIATFWFQRFSYKLWYHPEPDQDIGDGCNKGHGISIPHTHELEELKVHIDCSTCQHIFEAECYADQEILLRPSVSGIFMSGIGRAIVDSKMEMKP